jgi:phytoene synthase
MSGAPDVPAAPPPGTPRWYAWLFTPRRARDRVALLFALESEWRSTAARHVDHAVAHLKLNWWRDEIKRLAQGMPLHPLTRSLAAAAPHAGSLPGPLGDFLTSVELELAEVAVDDEQELERFLALADGLARAMVVALSDQPADAETLRIGSAIGQAVRGVQIVADWRHAPINEQRRIAMLRLAAHSRARWDSSLHLIRYPEHEALRGLRVLGRLHIAMLDRLHSEDYRPGDRGVGLPAMQSLWTAWRAARQH